MKKILCLVSLVLFSGCISEFDQNGNFQNKRQKIGTISGVASGAMIGSYIGSGANQSVFGTLVGGLLGGALGNRAGAYLDSKALQKMNQNAYYALNHGQSGHSYKWSEGNFYGDFTPTKDFYFGENNLYCREYYQTINIGGKQERAFGKACRMPDGAWKIMN